nr:ribonuclease H-like domain-containing protein [Tanacetum cinerariifolium]
MGRNGVFGFIRLVMTSRAPFSWFLASTLSLGTSLDPSWSDLRLHLGRASDECGELETSYEEVEEVTETVFDKRSSDEENIVANDRFKKGEGYHAVPPPLTGNYMPPKPDLSFAGPDDSTYKFKISETVTSLAKYEKDAPETSTACVEMPKEDRMAKKSVLPTNVGKGTGHKESRPVWTNVQRINHQNKFAPTAVFTRSGRIPVSAAKPKAAASTSADKLVNTAGPKQSVNFSRIRITFHKSHSPIRRSFYNATTHSRRNSTERVNTAGSKAVSAVKGNKVTIVKTSVGCVWRARVNAIDQLSKDNRWICTHGHLQQALKNKGIVDSGCSRHMIGNKAYLADYQKIHDGGFVTFGSSRGKITGKVKIRTEKLDFDDVCFVNELKFNLFSVLQMCDKKNSVLFTKTKCLVLSPNFKLLDESQVLLRIPKQSNMYSFDLQNVIPSWDLTCLFPKASINMSNLWHKRLGHVNFKTVNELVKGNLVRGLPLNFFNNDHCCVACQKGKQHKATCKAKFLSSISQPLQMLHMDLFVQHLALVIKTHNKTPYELLNGRSPRLDFMRPFGCPVIILNTLDPLRKFKGKADEGFLVGYSVTSKAFRVFNTKTIKVKENLHVRLLENKPNVVGTGPNWLFDIDSLTNSMNYILVSAGNQTDKNAGPQDTNGNTGTQDNVDTGKEVSNQHYIVFSLWSSISSTYKSLDDKPADDKPKDDTSSNTVEEPVNKEDQAYRDELDRLMSQEKEASDAADALRKKFEQGCMDQRRVTQVGNTNSFNTVSNLVNAASISGTFSAGGPSSSYPDAFIPTNTLLHVDQDDSQIHDLEETVELQSNGIFNSAYDDDLDIYTSLVQSMGAEADFNNMESSTIVSPIPIHKVHIDHPKDQILRDPKLAVQTKGMAKKSSGAHALVSYIHKQRRTNHKDYENCLFSCFLSQMEPKKVYRNKKDERGIVVRNKARLVAQGHKHEEGIDYDEVFALVARIEAIRIFLVFASFVGFIIYQMNVKSTFLYGTMTEEVYISQPLGFIDPQFPNKIPNKFHGGAYILLRTAGEAKEGIFIIQDKYVSEILKKFDVSSVKIASTPIETQKPLVKDKVASDVDVHLYRSMIGSLMYLKASRPHIMFAVYACSRFQVTPKLSHLQDVKRIFRYHKEQPKLGLGI